MAPVDARTKLESLRRKIKQKSKSGPTVSKSANGNIKDLRQIIAKKSKRKNERSPTRTAQGRIAKQPSTRSNLSSRSKDLRDSNKKLASRRNAPTQSRERGTETRNKVDQRNVSSRQVSSVNRRTITNTQAVKIGKKVVQQQQYYVPPHLQRNQPTYIVSGPPTTQASIGRKPNLSIDSGHIESSIGSASILISNLSTEATQSDIIEIFGNVGIMIAVNIINQTTALVTYQNSSDAVRAVKFYNNRLLDGKPMLVNMMPNSV